MKWVLLAERAACSAVEHSSRTRWRLWDPAACRSRPFWSRSRRPPCHNTHAAPGRRSSRLCERSGGANDYSVPASSEGVAGWSWGGATCEESLQTTSSRLVALTDGGRGLQASFLRCWCWHRGRAGQAQPRLPAGRGDQSRVPWTADDEPALRQVRQRVASTLLTGRARAACAAPAAPSARVVAGVHSLTAPAHRSRSRKRVGSPWAPKSLQPASGHSLLSGKQGKGEENGAC